MAESRGKVEDMELKRVYRELWESGTMHRGSAFFRQALTSKEIKLEKKQANIAGLQIADLLAHPIKYNILQDQGIPGITLGDFAKQICQAIDQKFNRHEFTKQTKGYGKVYLK